MRRALASLAILQDAPWLALLVTVVLLCAPHVAQAQTVCAVPGKDGAATISGVVNTYHQGTLTASSGSASITVGSSRIGGASVPISNGDLLLVIQMQDADFNSTNGTTYGDGSGGTTGSGWTALNNAGLYEYVVATNTITLGGGTITIRGTGAGSGLRNTYTNAAANSTSGQKRFQVIRVPQYSTATLGSVTAPAWDGSTGGIVAFDVAGALNLTGGSVNVAGLGFRGGGSRDLDGDKSNPTVAQPDDFALSATYAAHGSKGEGIAGTPRYVYNSATGLVDDTFVEGYPGGSHARGAPANAGGGGTDADPNDNQENSGGGGGSNGGAGGRGGNTWQSNSAVGGYGGASFAGSAATNRIIMGGGGGGGTRNNDTTIAASTGAAGGGIVMIRAGSFTGSATINASGASAYDNTLNDGGGGGGAGGSVIVMGTSGIGGITINVNGGTGGDAWHNQDANGNPGERHGPGGGGSGGIVYYSSVGGAPSVSRAGGANGVTTTSASAYGATAGAAGPAPANITFAATQGVSPSYLCLPSLTTTKTTTTASVTNSPTGTTATYRITVANAANLGSAISVNISDTLPTNFTYASTTSIVPSGNATQDSVSNPTVGATVPSWGVFTIPGGGQVQITFVVNISRVVLSGTYQNPARANYLDPVRTLAAPNNTLNVDYNSASSTGEDVTVTSRADMTITKSHTGNFTQGQTNATYTLTATNSGSGQTSGTVTVTDTLPAGLTPTSFTAAAPWSCSIVTQTVTCTRSDALIAGNSYSAITVTVSVSATAPASITNTASVSGGGQTNTANDTASDPTTINQLADLTITKTHTGNFTQGQTNAPYTITVTNSGNGATSGTVTVTDTLPTGLTFVSGTAAPWSCSAIGQVVTCTRSDSLAALSSYPALTLNVNVAANAPTSVTNSVAVSGGGEIITNNNSATDPTTINGVPDLTITKSHTGNFTQGQANATYTLTVTNSGTAATSGTVTVTDTLPAGLSFVSGSAAPWSCGAVGQVVTCSRSDALAVSSSYPALTLTVNVSATAPASVTNTASVSVSGELNTGNNSASDVTTINQVADLTIAKTHTGNFTQGQIAAPYTITVTNSGTGATSGTVTVTDTLPTGLAFNSGSGSNWGCSAVLQVVTCQRNVAIAASTSTAITLNVNVAANAPFNVTNSVAVSGGGEVVTNNNSATDPTTINGVPDVTITKTHTGNFTQGQSNAPYTITVTNSGTAATSGTVTVTDTLPAGLSFASASPAAVWNCGAVGQVVTCTNTNALNAGASYTALTLNVNVAANAPFSVTNTATVSGGGQTNTANDTASDPTTINGVPDLTITKTHTGNFTQGQTNAPYTITVTNSGTAATSGTITVTDTLPAGLSYASFSGSAGGWGCGAIGQVVTCTNSNVIAASSSYAALTLNVNVSATAPASVTNSASVSGGGETNTGNNSASNPTTINPIADLIIAKTHTGNFTRGSIGTYSITVTNNGTGQTSGNVTVTDTLPAGLMPTGWSGSPQWSCVIASQTVTCTNTNTLNAGASYTAIGITVSVAQSAASSLTNTATVSGGGQVVTTNDTSSDPTTIVSSSDLSLTKVTTNPGSGVGSTAVFTLTLTNTGPSDATGVAVRDQLPAGLTYLSSIASVGSYNSGTGIWTVGNVASGISPTLQISARIDVVGSLTNTAQVSTSNQPDPDSTPNNNNAAEDDQASASLSTAPPNVTLCKTIQGQPCPPGAPLNMPPGSDITYVITFTNSGGSYASSFVITDPIPANTDFKVGSVSTNLASTGLSVTVFYSYDSGNSFVPTPLPTSGGGSAPAGYDRTVTHVRWQFTGNLSHLAPANAGSVGFTVRIR
jgi:uncharacterized repeat protein (TIGR01451 family)/fimbrial isopeptide formation D2 family protein